MPGHGWPDICIGLMDGEICHCFAISFERGITGGKVRKGKGDACVRCMCVMCVFVCNVFVRANIPASPPHAYEKTCVCKIHACMGRRHCDTLLSGRASAEENACVGRKPWQRCAVGKVPEGAIQRERRQIEADGRDGACLCAAADKTSLHQ